MSEEKLNQLVKGAPLPEARTLNVSSTDTSTVNTPPANPSDPLATLPSSPPQIYLNLLLLEASLRAQYLELRARRRSHTFFLTLLLLWNLFFLWALFLKPREDGSGVGGSIYWVVEMTEKMCLMGGVVTGMLVWGTGQWERGIRWPRRWVGTTNRGLRGFNLKVVVVKGPWWKELWETISFIFSYGLFSSSRSSSYRYISSSMLPEEKPAEHNTRHNHHMSKNSSGGLPNIHEEGQASSGIEEDLSPSGDYIRLLLLPKPFSPSFRENWDLYRTEYWDKENERRVQLCARLKEYDLGQARKRAGWLWWTGYRGLSFHSSRKEKGLGGRGGDVEKSVLSGHMPVKEGLLSVTSRGGKRLSSGSVRSGSHSRNSSRSSTPDIKTGGGSGSGEVDFLSPSAGADPPSRGGSSGSTTSSASKGKKRGSVPTRGSLRSSTPDSSSPLGRGGVFGAFSDGEVDGRERSGTPTPSDAESLRSLRTREKAVAVAL